MSEVAEGATPPLPPVSPFSGTILADEDAADECFKSLRELHSIARAGENLPQGDPREYIEELFATWTRDSLPFLERLRPKLDLALQSIRQFPSFDDFEGKYALALTLAVFDDVTSYIRENGSALEVASPITYEQLEIKLVPAYLDTLQSGVVKEFNLLKDQYRQRSVVPLTEIKRSDTGEVGNSSDAFAELREFARVELKGKERAVIEALCEANGELPMADLSVKNGMDWEDIVKGFKDVQRRLNLKLKQQGWRLVRDDNAAKLKVLKRGQKAPFSLLD